jgi:uncharacterized protein YegP (UPF0339 family)
LVSDNGQILLRSEGYTSKAGCLAGIRSVQVNSVWKDRFNIRQKNSSHYFVLKASNGEILGTSETFYSLQRCEQIIALMQQQVPHANIED